MQQADGPTSDLPAPGVASTVTHSAQSTQITLGRPARDRAGVAHGRGHGLVANASPQGSPIQVAGCCAPNSTAAATSRTISATPSGDPWA